NSLIVSANDADGTSPTDRADLVRAGETGLLDTWWIPSIVVAHCISVGRKDDNGNDVEAPCERALRTMAAVTEWKTSHERIADLSYADLSYANLSSANLRSADLRYADLSYADLSYANLRSADLRYANLSSANLSYAYGNA